MPCSKLSGKDKSRKCQMPHSTYMKKQFDLSGADQTHDGVVCLKVRDNLILIPA